MPSRRTSRMNVGIRMTTSANATRIPWTIASPPFTRAPRRPNRRTRSSTSRSRAAPREALTRIASPGREAPATRPAAAARSAARAMRVAGIPARDAPSAMARPRPRPRRPAGRRARPPGAHREMARPSPRPAPASRPGPRRAGRAAWPAARARRPPNRATRCSCRRARTTVRQPHEGGPVGCGSRARCPGRSWRASSPAACPTAAAASALWTECRPSAGVRTARRRRAARSVKLMPVGAQRHHVQARTSAAASKP